ncbi:Protein CBG21451 [Caenorhabditis briggsae]|uniref:Protein CBG21451 n=1 Tax=Caenorhabditis briggsae TaxID=6238 RepID=A8Y029_CAEBR|nr:Protein CBG21451 [Caenorhabditis briggsae]CAP38247.2 Protein CBG21451 [Caenorhabditis briggsae]
MIILDIVFLATWILLLLGLFILSREFLFEWLKSENLAIFGAFLGSVIILFEAILMLEEHKWRDGENLF